MINVEKTSVTEEAAINDALRRGNYTAAEVMAAFTTAGR